MSWNHVEKWYSGCVGEKGHYYHQSVILPNLLRLLALSKKASLLDCGCGQGVLERHLPKTIEYWGLDSSPDLIQTAKKLTKREEAHFLVADTGEPFPIEKRDFDAACFLLSLQNMENPEAALLHAGAHLKEGGKLVLVLNHPCFRIPRQSSWGIDEAAKLQYRKIQTYLSPQKIPIHMHPGKNKEVTYSYHFPLSSYVQFLANAQLAVTAFEEWCSDKKSEGSKAKMEDRARREIPLFLAIVAKKFSTL